MANNDGTEKKGFIAEFKEFIARGNVIDMAVGIIIGTAFTAIVTSLVNDIISPVIGYAIGGIDFSNFSITLPSLFGDEPVEIKYGVFIQSVVSFLLTALAVFFLVKFMNKLSRKKDEPAPEEPAPAPEPTAEEKLLTEIRDLLKDQNK